jgi:L-galactose dehydrogenase
VLGDALADVPRQSYYIGTKVGRYEKNVLEMFDFSKERVQRSVRESLARLKLDYVDIIQVQVGRVTCGV